MEWFNQLGYRDCTRHGLMTSSEMDSYDPCGFSLSLIYLESTFRHSCNRWVPWGRVLWGMKVNLKQKRPVQTALLVKFMKFNDTKTWNSAGGSKQLDHALPGFADSDPFHWNEKGQEALGGFSGSWASVCVPRTLRPTWYLQEVLDEADVVLGLRWQLLEAPGSLGAAAPAGQRLVLHRHSCQNVHVRCDRNTLLWTSKHQFSGPRKNIQAKKKMTQRMETNVDLHPMLLSYIFPPLS